MPALTIREAGEPIGSLTWTDDWYIDFLWSDRPQVLMRLLVQFRRVWRDAGYPPLNFDVAVDNAAMQALATTLGASPFSTRYVVVKS